MSSGKSFGRFSRSFMKLFLLSALAVLSCGLMQNSAWALSGFKLGGFDHHGLKYACGPAGIDPLTLLGNERDNLSWIVTPGSSANGGLITARSEMDGVSCHVTYCDKWPDTCTAAETQDLGTSTWNLVVQFKSYVTTGPTDSNKGNGNEVCSSLDPDNPGSTTGTKGKNKGGTCTFNQLCSASPTRSGYSNLNISVSCQQAVPVDGRGVGYMQYAGPYEGEPAWTNCYPGQGTNCAVQLGGFPTDKFGVVDPTQCAAIFPALDVNGDGTNDLAAGQVLSLTQEYPGTCATSTQPPAGTGTVINSVDRECNANMGGGTDPADGSLVWPSGGGPRDTNLQFGQGLYGDGLDNAVRVCPQAVGLNGTAYQTAKTQTNPIASIQNDLGTLPPSQNVNLKCDAGSDSGQIWVTICGAPGLNVRNIQDVALEGGQRPNLSSFGSFSACGADSYEDVQVRFLSCTAAGTGMAQVIWGKAGAGECTHDPVQDHDTCPVGIQTSFAPLSTGVVPIHGSTMNVEVVNTSAIP